MKKILIIFEEIYKREGLIQHDKGECVGFCSISSTFLTPYQYKRFQKYLREWVKESGQTIFFTYDNEETYCKSQFVWNSEDFNTRLEWLEKHINLLTK
jgi:hypothetical protein